MVVSAVQTLQPLLPTTNYSKHTTGSAVEGPLQLHELTIWRAAAVMAALWKFHILNFSYGTFTS